MDRKFGYVILAGLIIGAVFGIFIGIATGNTILGIGIGALGGVFIGWFVAAAAAQSEKGKTSSK